MDLGRRGKRGRMEFSARTVCSPCPAGMACRGAGLSRCVVARDGGAGTADVACAVDVDRRVGARGGVVAVARAARKAGVSTLCPSTSWVGDWWTKTGETIVRDASQVAAGDRLSVRLARGSLEVIVDKTQEHVTGTARLKLYKGNVIVAGRSSPYSLYREDFATFGKEDVYDQSDAEGFITLFGLPMKVHALLDIAAGGARFKEPDYSQFKRD